MRVLFVISCLSYGGAEKNLILIANYLTNNHDVSICNFNEHETRQIINDKIKVFNMKNVKCTRKIDWMFLRWRQYKYLEKICIRKKPDIIVSFLPIPNALATLCGKKLHIPVVISERADPYQQISKLDKIMHIIYNRADGAVFQTNGAKSFYNKKLQRNSVVIPNPVLVKHVDIIHEYYNTKKEIVCVGRFEIKQKRQDLLLQAFEIVLKKHSDYKLVFWGDGPDESVLKKYVLDNKMENNVVFAGVSDDIIHNINNSELMVLSSDYEGIPNALLEAMSIGLPCVATDCSPGGARMLLEDGRYGKLVSRGKHDELANAINELIEHKELEVKYGKLAKDSISRFRYDEIMMRWEEFLKLITHRKKYERR